MSRLRATNSLTSFKLERTFYAVPGHENFYVLSLTWYPGYDTANEVLLDFYRGTPMELVRHDPWTDAVKTRRVAPDPATGDPVFTGEDFPIESGWGYLLRVTSTIHVVNR